MRLPATASRKVGATAPIEKPPGRRGRQSRSLAEKRTRRPKSASSGGEELHELAATRGSSIPDGARAHANLPAESGTIARGLARRARRRRLRAEEQPRPSAKA